MTEKSKSEIPGPVGYADYHSYPTVVSAPFFDNSFYIVVFNYSLQVFFKVSKLFAFMMLNSKNVFRKVLLFISIVNGKLRLL